jgi:hypothetical protein
METNQNLREYIKIEKTIIRILFFIIGFMFGTIFSFFLF